MRSIVFACLGSATGTLMLNGFYILGSIVLFVSVVWIVLEHIIIDRPKIRQLDKMIKENEEAIERLKHQMK